MRTCSTPSVSIFLGLIVPASISHPVDIARTGPRTSHLVVVSIASSVIPVAILSGSTVAAIRMITATRVSEIALLAIMSVMYSPSR